MAAGSISAAGPTAHLAGCLTVAGAVASVLIGTWFMFQEMTRMSCSHASVAFQ